MRYVYKVMIACLTVVCLAKILLATGTQNIGHAHDSRSNVHHQNYASQRTSWLASDILIDTSIVYAPAENEQVGGMGAFNGMDFLIIWADDRVDRHHDDLYGARVSADGTVLDPAGIAISVTDSLEGSGGVGCDGSDFLVVWNDTRYGDSQIFGARVTGEGEVLDPEGFPIITEGSYLGIPSIAFGDSNYLLVWTEYNGSDRDIFGARVTPSGVLIDTANISISTATGNQSSPKVVFDGYKFFIAWCDTRDDSGGNIYYARVTQSGYLLDGNGIPLSTDTAEQHGPKIAVGDSTYLIVWTHGRYDVCGARVSHPGEILDTNFIVISSAYRNQMSPSIAFDGTNYFVTWHDGRNGPYEYDIYGARVDELGVVLDSQGLQLTAMGGSEYNPRIHFGTEEYLLFWLKSYDIQGTRVDQDGNVLDTLHFTLSTAANNQSDPSVTYRADDYFVVWEDWRGVENYDVRGARLTNTGLVLDHSGLDITADSCMERFPSIAAWSNGYFVVWQDMRNGTYDIYGTRLDSMGTIIDTLGIPISTAQYDQEIPVVIFDGTQFFLVWCDKRHGGIWPRVYGARVDTSGTVLDTAGILISPTGMSQYTYDVAVACDGNNYFVVWAHGIGHNNVYGARIDQSGTVLDTNGIVICNAPMDQEHPSVAFDGLNYFVVWQDGRGPHPPDIYGTRVTQDGGVIDSTYILLCDARRQQRYPVVVFDGSEYVVVWQDGRNDYLFDLHGVRVDTSGVVMDSFVVAEGHGRQTLPAIAHGSEGQVLAAYSGWIYDIGESAANTMRIWGSFHPSVTVEEKPDADNIAGLSGLVVFPNPVQQLCNVSFSFPKASSVCITLYDVAGRLLKEVVDVECNGGRNTLALDIEDLSQGVYFLRLKTADSSYVTKFVHVD